MNKGQKLLEAVDERGEISFLDLATKPQNAAAGENLLAAHLGSGETIFVQADRLTEIAPDRYRFDGSFQDVRRDANQTSQPPQSLNQPNSNERNLAAMDARTNERGEIVVPLIAEEISVSKKTVETGGIRVHKTVREDVQTIDEPIIREHIEAERVEINQFVETAPAVRYEGEVMIVPVLEEVVVTQKRLLLREEIHLVKRREEISNPQEITLRCEEISLEKIDSENTEAGVPER
jgi:uncharacterized protein (TIGR02271 family)